MDQTLMAAAAGAREALGGAGETHGASAADQPRYELFHAASSICSQKVRVVLAHRGLAYAERTVDMFLGQTYLPGYVRLRMLGCDRHGGELAAMAAARRRPPAGATARWCPR